MFGDKQTKPVPCNTAASPISQVSKKMECFLFLYNSSRIGSEPQIFWIGRKRKPLPANDTSVFYNTNGIPNSLKESSGSKLSIFPPISLSSPQDDTYMNQKTLSTFLREDGGFETMGGSLFHSLALAGFDGGDASFPAGPYLPGCIHCRMNVLVCFIILGQHPAEFKYQMKHFITMQTS